ncbi:MAG: hypothetical protein U5L04_05775 [Trueperaceae bacterium]|nr:hypothetical protein [Trueperaceae bacterium]
MWHFIFAAAAVTVCIALVVSIRIPFGQKQWAAYREIKQELELANQAEHFPHRIRSMQAAHGRVGQSAGGYRAEGAVYSGECARSCLHAGRFISV